MPSTPLSPYRPLVPSKLLAQVKRRIASPRAAVIESRVAYVERGGAQDTCTVPEWLRRTNARPVDLWPMCRRGDIDVTVRVDAAKPWTPVGAYLEGVRTQCDTLHCVLHDEDTTTLLTIPHDPQLTLGDLCTRVAGARPEWAAASGKDTWAFVVFASDTDLPVNTAVLQRTLWWSTQRFSPTTHDFGTQVTLHAHALARMGVEMWETATLEGMGIRGNRRSRSHSAGWTATNIDGGQGTVGAAGTSVLRVACRAACDVARCAADAALRGTQNADYAVSLAIDRRSRVAAVPPPPSAPPSPPPPPSTVPSEHPATSNPSPKELRALRAAYYASRSRDGDEKANTHKGATPDRENVLHEQ